MGGYSKKKAKIGVKEVMKEGRYDSIANEISSKIFNTWKKKFSSKKKKVSFRGRVNTPSLQFDIDATLWIVPNTDDFRVSGGADYSKEAEYDDRIDISYEIDPELLPEHWSAIAMELRDTIRHEIEHLTHGEGDNYKTGKDYEDDTIARNLIRTGTLRPAYYFKLDKEIDANIQGLRLKAKKLRKPFKEVVSNYLDKFVETGDITPEEKKEIQELWRERLKKLGINKEI